MKRTRFTDEQIIGILGEHEAGAKCADLCRKHAGHWISSMTSSPMASASAFSTWSMTSRANAWLRSQILRSRGGE